MSSLNAHTSDFVLDDDDDGEMRDVDTSLTTSSPPASAPPLPHLHIVPPPPPPSAMLNPSAGAYHPDFMFCGTCTQCQEPDDKVELQDDEKLETYDEDDINNLDADIVILKTKFHLRQSLHNPSHMLVIQSLVKQIPGVSKVMIQSQDSSVVVDHDASLSTESVLRTLESVGHSAVIQSPQVNPTAGGYTDQAMGSSVSPGSMESGEGQPMWVRSQFYVRGICCASEVPVIKKIVKPLVGVSKLQINITTKMVHVQHDASVISAQVIAGVLSREGFPSRVERDGKASAVSRQQAMHHGRSTLKVHGTLSDADVSKIQASLSHLAGVSRIGVNISESLIYVDHDVYTVTSAQCVQALQPEFICDVQTAAEQTAGDSAALMLSSIAKSKYVESTIQVEGLDTKQIRTVEKAIAQNFIRSQVRAIYPNIISETVKVEHDPKQVSILDVCNTLASYGLSKVQVTVNGGDAGLYLPEHSSGPQVSYGDEPSLLKIHANVWLSGVFWVLSMVSYRPG
jgi:copper chaperone CopZ